MLVLVALQSYLMSLMTDLASQLHSDYIMLSITKLAELTVVVLVSSGFVQNKNKPRHVRKSSDLGRHLLPMSNTALFVIQTPPLCATFTQPENLRTVTTENFDSNLKCWTKKANTLF